MFQTVTNIRIRKITVTIKPNGETVVEIETW